MQVQPQLVLLQKTLLYIEGLGRQLYPQLDLWKTAKPFLENWVKQQMGPWAVLRQIKENLPFWAEKLPEMPTLLHSYLQQHPRSQQQLLLQMQLLQQKQLEQGKSLKLVILAAAFVVSATILLALGQQGLALAAFVIGSVGAIKAILS